MELITVMPRTEHSSGIQSTNVRWISEPLSGDREKAAASMIRKSEMENC
jgi:hypothetical protein